MTKTDFDVFDLISQGWIFENIAQYWLIFDGGLARLWEDKIAMELYRKMFSQELWVYEVNAIILGELSKFDLQDWQSGALEDRKLQKFLQFSILIINPTALNSNLNVFTMVMFSQCFPNVSPMFAKCFPISIFEQLPLTTSTPQTNHNLTQALAKAHFRLHSLTQSNAIPLSTPPQPNEHSRNQNHHPKYFSFSPTCCKWTVLCRGRCEEIFFVYEKNYIGKKCSNSCFFIPIPQNSKMAATSVIVLDRSNNTTCTINLHGKY